MRRHIIRQKTAFTITLPVKWVRACDLTKGGEVAVEQNGDALLIRADEPASERSVTIELPDAHEDSCRILIENQYLRGKSLVNVKAKSPSAIGIIRDVVSNLIGFEIVHQTNDECIISATAQPRAEEFHRLLLRALDIIQSTQDIIQTDLDNKKFVSLTEVESLTKDARRFLLYCTRTLHMEYLVPQEDVAFVHLLLERLILIQHSHLYMYQKLSGTRSGRIRSEVIRLYGRVCDMFIIFRRMLERSKAKEFTTLSKEWHSIYFEEGHDLFEHCTRRESIIVFHSMYLAKLIWLISQPNLVELELLQTSKEQEKTKSEKKKE